MPELLSSKVILSEEEPSIRDFPVLASAVLGIQGIAERGPIAEATLVSSYAEYERIFGSFISGRQMALAVRAFFLSGGRQCYVSRTCHFTNPTNKATAAAIAGAVTLATDSVSAAAAIVTGVNTAPWRLEPGDTLIGRIDREAGPYKTATFNATAAAIECANADTSWHVDEGFVLNVKIDEESTAQVITFHTTDFVDHTAATAEEVVAVINNQINGARATATTTHTKVTITSDKRGTGSHVEVTGGTANAIFGFDTTKVHGSGNVVDIHAVAYLEAKAIIEAAWTTGSGVVCSSTGGALRVSTVATGAARYIEVRAASSCEQVFGFTGDEEHQGSDAGVQNTLTMTGKTPGAYANNLKIKIYTSASGDASEFNLYVISGTDVLESFANLTMDSTGARYVETILNSTDYGSLLFTATDLDATGSPTIRRPVNTSGATPTAGDDGLTSLADNDYIGSKTGGTGFYAFDNNPDVTIMICPDSTAAAVQKAMIAYCVTDKQGMVFAILDPTAGLSTVGILAQQTALGAEGVTENAAMYWPRLTIVNPSQTVFGASTQTITVTPSGYVAGIMALNDRESTEGPFYQPAGVEGGRLYGVVGLETTEVNLEAKRDLIFPKRINPINYMKSWGIFIDGARTLKGTGNFPSIGERRGVSHIEKLLQDGLQWVRHRNNTPDLRQSVRKQVYALLHGWMRRGSFASQDPAKAFFVDVSDGLNPPSVVRAGQLVLRVGMATNAPAEFVIIKVTKDTRALEDELFGTV